MKVVFSLLLASSLSFGAQAQEYGNFSETNVQRTTLLPENWKPLLALSTGYMGQAGDYKTEGFPTSLKGIASYYSPTGQWIGDLGFGFQFQNMHHGSDPIVPVGEAAARYNLGNQWSLGPIMNTYFAEPARYGSVNNNVTSFIGVGALKEFTLSKYDLRAGLTAMTDMDIPGHQVNTIQASLHIALGGSKQAAIASEPVQEYQPASHLIRASGDLAWSRPLAHFELNKANLSPQGKSYLIRVADILKANNEKIDSMTVVGHTDQSGPEKLNKTLSVERAKTVAAFLKTRGIASNKIKMQGKASTELISTTELAPNRRAELKLNGVDDIDSVQQSIQSIQ